MTHLKRLNAPKSWPLKQRKTVKYIARPSSGPHKLKNCITLNVVLKDVLHYAKTTREVKKILDQEKILLNDVARKDHKFPVGFMDYISIPSLNKYYCVLYGDKSKFIFSEIKKEDTGEKTCKIIGKTKLKKGKLQLNLHDSRNILVDKDIYKVGDSILLDLNKNKIKKHFKFEKNAVIFLIGGKYVGTKSTLIDIKEGSSLMKSTIIFKKGKEKLETLKEYAFVVEK